jgi:hypothetical protein
MKVIFLDIDGVLNGIAYQMSTTEAPPLIDVSRLEILKELIDKSNAKVVLSSSWKKAWVKGQTFDCIFKNAGIDIYDTTPVLGRKNSEISAWLSAHSDIESFVILDDAEGGWDELSPNVVITNPIQENGLEKKHIPLALEKLENNRHESPAFADSTTGHC